MQCNIFFFEKLSKYLTLYQRIFFFKFFMFFGEILTGFYVQNGSYTKIIKPETKIQIQFKKKTKILWYCFYFFFQNFFFATFLLREVEGTALFFFYFFNSNQLKKNQIEEIQLYFELEIFNSSRYFYVELYIYFFTFFQSLKRIIFSSIKIIKNLLYFHINIFNILIVLVTSSIFLQKL
eukprot:TRINITY_DN4540_c1_g2_i1.p9 TRINITY_DN4540_c1_g2~~TRINITY_DN4540_c1_g2_i1.p9  ORF type:complete len:179 (+),score=5.15 TRINITY_DN4540_c1_g2_i1:545-1081(+)